MADLEINLNLRGGVFADDLSEVLLPDHRAINWFNKWCKDAKRLNPEALDVIRDRIDVLVERFDIKAEQPSKMIMILNGILQRYNGMIYEENGVMMEIDLFNDICSDDEDVEAYFFAIGNTPIFNRYIFDHYPEVLI